METIKITKGQLQRLQVLYSQFARHTLVSSVRESRLAWASQCLQRPVASFSDLSASEAKHLIDSLQSQLGVKAPAKRRKRLDRDAANRAGNDGRRSDDSKQSTLAGATDLARIQYALDLLGWNQSQFEAWIHSPRSPLGRQSNPKVRTVGDANRIWWALKKMAQARGLWKENSEYRRPA